MNNAIKVWYIKIGQKGEGPFSIEDLKLDSRINLDTLVWRVGFVTWIPLKEVEELVKALFEPPSSNKNRVGFETMTMDISHDPDYLYWIIILLIIALFYFTNIFR